MEDKRGNEREKKGGGRGRGTRANDEFDLEQIKSIIARTRDTHARDESLRCTRVNLKITGDTINRGGGIDCVLREREEWISVLSRSIDYRNIQGVSDDTTLVHTLVRGHSMANWIEKSYRFEIFAIIIEIYWCDEMLIKKNFTRPERCEMPTAIAAMRNKV